MKTLIKKITLLLVSIFCLACTPNIPIEQQFLWIHQTGWGFVDSYYDNNDNYMYQNYGYSVDAVVKQCMEKSYDGTFTCRGNWKSNEERTGFGIAIFEDNRWDSKLLKYESEVEGSSDLYWGEIVDYIYSPSSQSLDVVSTGEAPTFYWKLDDGYDDWEEMVPEEDGTFSCTIYHESNFIYYIYINTTQREGEGALKFDIWNDVSKGDRVKYTFNPKTKQLNATKIQSSNDNTYAQVRFQKTAAYMLITEILVQSEEYVLASYIFGDESGTSPYYEIPEGYAYPIMYYIEDLDTEEGGYRYMLDYPYYYYFEAGCKYTIVVSDDGNYLTFDVVKDGTFNAPAKIVSSHQISKKATPLSKPMKK